MADYAISNVPRRVVYAASGVGPYAFTFEILNQTDIAVYKASTLLTLTTDYTVTINANGTGSVTLVLTAGTSNITIVGAKNIQRTTDFTTGGDLFANTLNDELDNQTIFIQQVAETAERGLKAPVVDPTDINMTLPAKASRVGTVLAFNATTGNPEAGPSIGSVTTVAAQSANINTVAANIASVNTVAGNITNVNTVAGISSDVTMVATFQYNVNTVADDLNEPTSEINTVAVDIANVNAVGTNISNVNAVAGNATNINAVNSNATNINTVANNITYVNTTANNIENVNTVAGIAFNVSTVASISGNVTTVANNSANVTTVAGSIANVNNVGNNIANVNQVAADTAAINSASANAAAAAASADLASNSASTATTQAGIATTQATNAATSAAQASAVALGNEPVRHSVRPSLLLDFANTKTLDPRITFTRASAGSYYDGKTVALAEQNLLLRSQEFDNASWTKGSATVTANSTAAPDGTTTADTFTSSAGAAGHEVYQTGLSIPVNTPFTISVFIKAGTHNFFSISANGANSAAWFVATVDLSTGTITKTGAGANGTYTSSTITSVGNSWYRVTVTGSTSQAFSFITVKSNSTNNPTYAGYAAESWTAAGTETCFLWGAQLEQRSTVTAYTATTTAPITNYVPVLLSAPANVARFEHNPTTGESLGLEIEEQRTNLLTYSEDWSNAAWIKTNSTISANTIVAPDGTLTGDKLVEDTATSSHQVRNSATASNVAHTFSVYLKAGERTSARVDITDLATGEITVIANLSNGTIGTVSSSGSWSAASAAITSVGNGWYRVALTGTKGGGSSAAGVVNLISGTSTVSYAGNGFSGIYIWGAQLEAGAFATSYIPTTVSQVTRSADSASMTGANFSSWFRTDEGSIYSEASCYAPAVGVRCMASIDTGVNSSANVIDLRFQTHTYFNINANAATQASLIGAISPAVNAFSKLVGTYKTNDSAASGNGGTVSTDTTVVIPNPLTRLNIGNLLGDTVNYSLNGTIKKLAYYPKRLTNAELIGLTTV